MITMLRSLVKQANNSGARLRVYKPKNKEYKYCISGQDIIGRKVRMGGTAEWLYDCLLYTSPSPRDRTRSRMPSSA